MKKLFFLLLLLLISILIFYFEINKISGNFLFEENDEIERGFVTKVIDGDTIIVEGENVRLLGIDTPERGENCYREAKEKLEELILNREVLLEKDVRDTDQYKRLLRYVFIEEEGERISVNLKMVEEGYAIARFYEDKKYKEEIVAAEKKAREEKIGCKWT